MYHPSCMTVVVTVFEATNLIAAYSNESTLSVLSLNSAC